MYATKVSLLNCSEEIKTLVKSEECYRQYIMDLLSVTPTFKAPTKVCGNNSKGVACECHMCLRCL
ncbi:hypothetical protein DPMN_075999 [Dreissena polymorpha]|uniref:Uncharacterized protein n=1 Tax=Dreissena polymorpha TaxID=45954 RepID=A0A9D3YJ90_DREPO|nr:hypothetical protein DPMN_075999 [Dreissena polymorpha]